MTHQQYLDRFRGTAVRRAKHWMLQRNAATALGNTGTLECLPALTRAMTQNDHPIVRGHAAWALGMIGARTGAPEAEDALTRALESEPEPSVREEIALAIHDITEARVFVESELFEVQQPAAPPHGPEPKRRFRS